LIALHIISERTFTKFDNDFLQHSYAKTTLGPVLAVKLPVRKKNILMNTKLRINEDLFKLWFTRNTFWFH